MQEKIMENISCAVIGSGFMGAAHVEALRRIPGVQIAAIVSDDRSRARQIAGEFGIPKVLTEWQALIEMPDIRVIHNCTPNNLHYPINKAMIMTGKHVISEKPLTINSREAEELVKLAEERKVVTAINFNYRFYPLLQHVRAMIAGGEVGDIYYVHGHYLQDWLFYDTDYNWRLETKISGESRAMADIGSHWCDMVQFLTGLEIESVFARLVTIHKQRIKPKQAAETFKGKEEKAKISGKKIGIGTEDIATVMLNFDNGSCGVVTVSQVSAGRKNHFSFEIDGSLKAVGWNQENPNELWIGYRDKANEILIKDPSLLDPEARVYAHYPGGHPEGYPDGPKNLFNNVYTFIRKGKTPGRDPQDFPDFRDGLRANRIVDAVIHSHREGKWVKV
jgi:predicted dehydrogenase